MIKYIEKCISNEEYVHGTYACFYVLCPWSTAIFLRLGMKSWALVQH